MERYVWCEDSGAGFEFWKRVFGTLYNGFTVESKKNNSELYKAVDKLADDKNEYFVMMDDAMDNPDVVRETQRLRKIMNEKKNVKVIWIHSFEFTLLSFKLLEKWVFAKEDELKDKRSKYLEFKDVFVDIVCNGGDETKLDPMRKVISYSKSLNREQLSSKLLLDITKNTGFKTTKGKVGECFINDCCTWSGRENDDICGLDEARLTADEKIKTIFEKSVLKAAFAEAGL